MSTMLDIASECLRDYGVHATAAGARRWARLIEAPRPITSAGQYVGACRAMARGSEFRLPSGEYLSIAGDSRIDGRLVAAGWNHESPTRWVGRTAASDSGLVRFLAYWCSTVARPWTIGSSCNLLEPEQAYRAMRMGVPAHVAGALGYRAIHRRRDPATADPARELLRRLPGRRIRRLRDAARAVKRTSLGLDSDATRAISTRALAALGRLCPELQRVAVDALRDSGRLDGDQPPVRIRDIPWDAVARVQAQLVADPSGRVRAAWSIGRRRCDLARRAGVDVESQDVDAIARWLAPAWPRVSEQQAYRLVRGETPAELSGGVLTRREAHDWLSNAPHKEPFEWLRRGFPVGTPLLRSVAVARWLLDVQRRGAWDALTREREIVGPGGQRISVRFLERVDEIQDDDLDRGPRTGVERAFDSAAQRYGSAWAERARADHRVLRSLPPGWRLYRCMRHLATPAALQREGDELRHCVGGYSTAVERGQSVIVSIAVLGHRSTVELSPSGRVLQHRGRNNSDPHPLCKRVLGRFIERRIS